MENKLCFIINPISGTSKKRKLESLITNAFIGNETEIEIHYSQYPGHACLITQEAIKQNVKAVIACGGDGTINEVGKELIGQEIALGIIALGSGNGLARHLNIPLSVNEALEVIKRYVTKTIDTGTINKLPFIGIAGVGFDAHIGKQFSLNHKRGFFTYLKLVLREYFNYKEKKIEIEHNGKTKIRKVLMVSIANSSQFGNNAIIAPEAKIDDGLLRLCVVRKFPIWKAPKIAWLMMNKKIHLSNYVSISTFKKIKIRQKKKLVHLDGEPIKAGKTLNIKVNPNSLQVIVP